jgi:hypothetical protein
MDADRKPPVDPSVRDQTGPATSYEPPLVEDLDETFGPSVTAAGGTGTVASPRTL